MATVMLLQSPAGRMAGAWLLLRSTRRPRVGDGRGRTRRIHGRALGCPAASLKQPPTAAGWAAIAPPCSLASRVRPSFAPPNNPGKFRGSRRTKVASCERAGGTGAARRASRPWRARSVLWCVLARVCALCACGCPSVASGAAATSPGCRDWPVVRTTLNDARSQRRGEQPPSAPSHRALANCFFRRCQSRQGVRRR